jgi:glycosyltransferase involved in cell wall biosynthesis
VIHILHVLTSLRLGGAERVIGDLVARTDPKRFRHTVVYFHPPHDIAEQLRAAGAEPMCLDAPTRRGWIAAARKLRPIVTAKKPDIIQSASFDGHVAGRLASLGAPAAQLSWLVSMDYDPASVSAAGWPRRSNIARKWIDRATAGVAGARFVACSDAVSRSAAEQLGVPPERMDVIYNPVDRATVQVAPGETEVLRRALGLPEGAFVYFTVGRMDAPKDQDTLLRAFAKVQARQPQAFLVILGNGALEKQLPMRADALGIADRTRFVPSAPRIAPFLELADVFVFPSLLEGLPVSVLEAMLAGVATVASDIEPHVEVIRNGHTGLLFPRGDDEALAAAMARLHGDALLRERFGTAAKVAAEAAFTTDIIVPQWEALYERLAWRRGAGQDPQRGPLPP